MIGDEEVEVPEMDDEDEMAMAEQQGVGRAAVLTGGGFVAWTTLLYGATRLFHWTWTRIADISR